VWIAAAAPPGIESLRHSPGGDLGVEVVIASLLLIPSVRRSTMHNRLVRFAILLAFSVVPLFGQEPKKEPEPLTVKVGDMAPDFTLLHYDGQGVKPVSLHDFRGKKNVALAFYVFAFTGG
jgi:hypothetical protein